MATPYRRTYTRTEQRQRASLIVRGLRHVAAGGHPDVEDRLNRLDERAEDRWTDTAQALDRQLSDARTAEASARAREKVAPRSERAAARQERRAAEREAKTAQRAFEAHLR